ncbi:MAG: helix-turn-helix domain-containing protein, partial [Pararhizobium sp.]
MLTCAESLQLADLMGVLTPAAMRLHFIIRGLTPATGGPTRPSTAKLCELTGMHETTVRAGLRELEKVGIVITERKHDRRGAQLRNAYTLCVNAIRGVAAMAR